jgi:hypothetical protein
MLDDAEARSESLQETIAVIAAAKRAPRIGADGVAEDGPEFNDVADAVRWAAAKLTNLQFHQRAFDSAAESAYRFPKQVYDDLSALDAVVGQWRKTGRIEAGGFYPALKAVGVPFAASVSPTALGLYPMEYAITDEAGARLELGPHLLRGSQTSAGHYRAYMHIDEATRTVTIGHVGRHLRGARDS